MLQLLQHELAVFRNYQRHTASILPITNLYFLSEPKVKLESEHFVLSGIYSAGFLPDFEILLKTTLNYIVDVHFLNADNYFYQILLNKQQ